MRNWPLAAHTTLESIVGKAVGGLSRESAQGAEPGQCRCQVVRQGGRGLSGVAKVGEWANAERGERARLVQRLLQELVADSLDGADPVPSQTFAQIGDLHRQVVFGDRFAGPDCVEQFALGDDLTTAGQQSLEQQHAATSEMKWLSIPPRRARSV